MVAELAHFYGFTPSEIRSMTMAEVRALRQRIDQVLGGGDPPSLPSK